MKEFITRTTTAFILIAFAYAIIKFIPPLYFSAFLFIIIGMGAMELLKLTNPVTQSPILIFLSGLVIALSFTLGKPDMSMSIIIIMISFGIYFLFSIRKKENLETFVRDFGIHFLIIFYLYVPLYYMFKLKKLDPNFLFFLIFVIAIGDSFAYFLGKAFGKTKIYPVASPKKSLQGLIASIVFAGASGWLSIIIFPVKVNPWIAVATGAIMGLFSQLSDPIESLFKRAANKKDSSSLLPGHGGVLDRVDSYIFCAPALYYIIQYFWR